MHSYIKTHGALEKMRVEAKESKSAGPRAMVVGPVDAGKSSLTRLLLTYAVRRGWKPTYVDLDVGQNGIVIPGCIAATPVEHPIGSVNLTNLQVRAPLAYYFGHATPSSCLPVYEKLVETLAQSVDRRCSENLDAKYSGVVINTCGWVDGKGFDLLVHCASVFKVDVILVLGNERLYSALTSSKDSRLAGIAVANLVKSAGVVSRDTPMRGAFRSSSIREYFYGYNGNLCPQKKVIHFNTVSIFQCGGGHAVPSTVLPIGTKSLIDPTKMSPVVPSTDLLNTILAVSYAPDSGSVMAHNVAGFMYVQEVDMQKKTMTCLVPTGGPLPGTTKSGTRLIAGSVKWLDS
jgi:polyribonucleotide 5'-hydroxyl-kinase